MYGPEIVGRSGEPGGERVNCAMVGIEVRERKADQIVKISGVI